MPPADLTPEAWWRAAAQRCRSARSYKGASRKWLDIAARDADLKADLLALDGVDLTLDALTQPCALTRAALTGDP
jgi:hypothetical protein